MFNVRGKGSERMCMLGRYITHLSRKSTDKYVNNLGNVAGSRDVLIIWVIFSDESAS